MKASTITLLVFYALVISAAPIAISSDPMAMGLSEEDSKPQLVADIEKREIDYSDYYPTDEKEWDKVGPYFPPLTPDSQDSKKPTGDATSGGTPDSKKPAGVTDQKTQTGRPLRFIEHFDDDTTPSNDPKNPAGAGAGAGSNPKPTTNGSTGSSGGKWDKTKTGIKNFGNLIKLGSAAVFNKIKNIKGSLRRG